MTTGFHIQRVFFEDDTTLIDATIPMNDFRQGTLALPFVSADDYLYIGSELPFNNVYMEVDTVNANASAPAIDIWTGTAWQPAVDILDFTATAGASLAKSGHIVFSIDEDEQSWLLEDDSEDVTGLETTRINNFYWMRMSWSADLSAGTILSYMGWKFSNDEELYSLYPDLNNTALLDSFKPQDVSGTKTTWDEQTFQAAQAIIMDLKKRNIIWSPKQILDFQLFKEASIHKTAAIIFAGLGGSQRDEAVAAMGRYDTAKNMGKYNIDTSTDGLLSRSEKSEFAKFGTR